MGLGTEDKTTLSTTFLNIAGGGIWDKSADKDHPKYKVQKYEFGGEEKERTGAFYEDLLGIVTKVDFSEKDFGRVMTFCNISFDVQGESYTISVKHNTGNSQALYPALLMADLDKPIKVSPYDFLPKGQSKRRSGITIWQDGVKLSKYDFEVPEKYATDANFWKTESQKVKDRLNEDLSDWFRAEIEEKIVPQLSENEPVEKESKKDTSFVDEPVTKVAEKTEEKTIVSPIKMKKALKAYIEENYEGKELPNLSKEDLVVWHELCLAEEELPFENLSDADLVEAEIEEDDIEAQLEALL